MNRFNHLVRFDANTGGATSGGNVASAKVGGVSATTGTPEGTKNDAEELRAQNEKLNALVQQRENDLRKAKAALDSKYAKTQTEYEARIADLEERFRQARTSGMDEKDRVAFELEEANLKNKRMEQRLQELEKQNQEQEQSQKYIAALKAWGVDESKLDTSSVDNLTASGWQAIGALITDLRQGSTPPAETPQTPKATPQIPNPPAVVTTNGKTPTQATGFPAIKAAVIAQAGVETMTDEEVYQYMETNVFDPNTVLNNK